MSLASNEKGQAMVEAGAVLGILFLFFVCFFYIFLMSIEKIRSLDTAYHLARAHQVQKTSTLAKSSIILLCFGRRFGRSQINPIHNAAGPAIDEAVFQFFPHTFRTHVQPWHSVMRVALPQRDFLNRSWPDALEDAPAGESRLTQEEAVLKGRVLSNRDNLWDAVDDVKETRKAEQG